MVALLRSECSKATMLRTSARTGGPSGPLDGEDGTRDADHRRAGRGAAHRAEQQGACNAHPSCVATLRAGLVVVVVFLGVAVGEVEERSHAPQRDGRIEVVVGALALDEPGLDLLAQGFEAVLVGDGFRGVGAQA